MSKFNIKIIKLTRTNVKLPNMESRVTHMLCPINKPINENIKIIILKPQKLCVYTYVYTWESASKYKASFLLGLEIECQMHKWQKDTKLLLPQCLAFVKLCWILTMTQLCPDQGCIYTGLNKSHFLTFSNTGFLYVVCTRTRNFTVFSNYLLNIT